jgi:Histone methylation protein DOT1
VCLCVCLVDFAVCVCVCLASKLSVLDSVLTTNTTSSSFTTSTFQQCYPLHSAIWEQVSALPDTLSSSSTRRLPSRFAERLNDLISKKHVPLYDAIRRAAISTDRDFDVSHFAALAVLEDMKPEWDDLFAECSTSHAKDISSKEKKELKYNGLNLVYGEVSFESLGIAMVKCMDFAPGGIFCDVGSGTGRAVFAAALLHDFDEIHGVEIMRGLHDAAEKVYTKWDREFIPKLYNGDHKAAPKIVFHCADLNKHDWSKSTFVFANSTCFDDRLMRQLSERAENLSSGAQFISLTKKLRSEKFRVISSTQYTMSWGMATVHSQVRL